MRLLLVLLVSSALAQTSPFPPVTASKSPAAQSPQASMSEALDQQKASIARQLQSVRQQAQTVGVRLAPWQPAPVGEGDCDPIPESEISPIIENAARSHKLETKLIRAVIEKESGFRPCAVSPKGAQGLMQIMPATAVQFGVLDAFDAKQNIDAGTRFLRQMLDKFGGDLAKALGAYNAGPAAVDSAGDVPKIAETQDYVDTVLKKLGATRTVQPNTPTPKPTGN